MKKLHIVGIIVIAISIGFIFTTFSKSGTYANFTEAFGNPEQEFHVVGKVNRSKEMVYEPTINPNEFRFYVQDDQGLERLVVLQKPKPQDIDHSEKVVLIGKAEGNTFVANDILLKCPSKYTDGTPQESPQ